MTLIIKPNKNPQCWVYSSNAEHPDMKTHKGIFMSVGTGGAYTSECKQKLKSKISMEPVAIDDVVAQFL